MTTRMKSHERRAAIVASASRLFAEKGFRGTTTRELAAALGVTEPVLYQHFRTKSDLYRAIIEAEIAEAQEEAAGFLSLSESDDDKAFFTALGDLILSRFEKDNRLSRLLLYSALESPELGELFFDRAIADLYRIVATFIERRGRAGAFRKVHADIVARGIIGIFHYHGLIRLLYPSRVKKVPRKKILAELVTVALQGIEIRSDNAQPRH
jgi:TetR/AcrR family transcriptional regulator